MHIPQELRYYLVQLSYNPALQQIAPLLVIILLPCLVLSVQPFFAPLFRFCLMVLESLTLVLPWNWFTSSSSGSVKKPRKKLVRTRAEQQGLNGDARKHRISSLAILPQFEPHVLQCAIRTHIEMTATTLASSISPGHIVSWIPPCKL